MSGSKVTIQEDSSESTTWFNSMTQQLNVVTVVIIIAGGVLTFLLLFIFAKRQIHRFTLRSHRGPHACIGSDANKTLRREIIRRIEALQKITYEPHVQNEDSMSAQYPKETSSKQPCHFYRMKAVDDAKNLELDMVKKKLGKRQSFESLRSYFIVTFTPEVDPRVVHQFCDMYEAARYNPKPFNEEDYIAFGQLLQQLRHAVTVLQPKSSSVRSPKKSQSAPSHSLTVEEKTGPFESLAAPYIRKIKKDKSKWTNNSRGNEEEHALCETSNLHEISIISSKEDSTAV